MVVGNTKIEFENKLIFEFELTDYKIIKDRKFFFRFWTNLHPSYSAILMDWKKLKELNYKKFCYQQI